MRAFAAISFRVGHARADDHIVALRLAHEGEVSLVILGAVLLVDVPGDGVQHADGVQPGAALKTGAGNLPQTPLHTVFQHQVLR